MSSESFCFLYLFVCRLHYILLLFIPKMLFPYKNLASQHPFRIEHSCLILSGPDRCLPFLPSSILFLKELPFSVISAFKNDLHTYAWKVGFILIMWRKDNQMLERDAITSRITSITYLFHHPFQCNCLIYIGFFFGRTHSNFQMFN